MCNPDQTGGECKGRKHAHLDPVWCQKRINLVQAEALEQQTTKVQRLQEDVEQRQGKPRAELEAELAQEAGALSGMQVPAPHQQLRVLILNRHPSQVCF